MSLRRSSEGSNATYARQIERDRGTPRAKGRLANVVQDGLVSRARRATTLVQRLPSWTNLDRRSPRRRPGLQSRSRGCLPLAAGKYRVPAIPAKRRGGAGSPNTDREAEKAGRITRSAARRRRQNTRNPAGRRRDSSAGVQAERRGRNATKAPVAIWGRAHVLFWEVPTASFPRTYVVLAPQSWPPSAAGLRPLVLPPPAFSTRQKFQSSAAPRLIPAQNPPNALPLPCHAPLVARRCARDA